MARKASVDKTPIEQVLEEGAVAEKTETAKKTAAKKTTATKKAVKCEMTVQFAGKSYTEEDLMKIAKDVWRFDLKQKVADLKEVELYVKPEESMVYYVFNGTESGSFAI